MLGYLDAGSGSMMIAAVAAGAAGAGVAVRAGLDKFRRGGRKGAAETTDTETEVLADDETVVEPANEA